jgi:hypothetical protein
LKIFGKAGLSKSFRILMKLYPQEHEVRAIDREYSLAWSAGVPSVTLASGQVYNCSFDTSETKKPIQDARSGNCDALGAVVVAHRLTAPDGRGSLSAGFRV